SFFFQAEDGIRDATVTGVQTCALPISIQARSECSAAATLVLLDPRYIPIWLGWRFAFGIGASLGLIVIFFRRWIPESPRWLMIRSEERRVGKEGRCRLRAYRCMTE